MEREGLMQKKIEKMPVIIVIVMLLLSLFPLPYGFYTLLRLVATGCSIYIAVKVRKMKDSRLFFIMLFIALLFNPLIPIHFDRSLWAVIDLIVAGIFVALFLAITRRRVK